MIELKTYQQTAVRELKERVVRPTNDTGFFCKSASRYSCYSATVHP